MLDVIALIEQDQTVAVVILFVRLGSVTGMTRFRFKNPAQSPEECLSDLIQQYYQGGKYIPQTILIPIPLEDQLLLEEVLSEIKGQKVELRVPSRGEGRSWMTMAEENCRSFLEKKEPGEDFQEKTAQASSGKAGFENSPSVRWGFGYIQYPGRTRP